MPMTDVFREFRKVMRHTFNKFSLHRTTTCFRVNPALKSHLMSSSLKTFINIAGVSCCCKPIVCTTLGRFIRHPITSLICHGTRRGTNTKWTEPGILWLAIGMPTGT